MTTVLVRIQRQDAPGKPWRWEDFLVPSRPQATAISCLTHIAARPITSEGRPTTPPVWDSDCLEEICGACTMIVNGRVRQACSAIVEKIVAPGEALTLQPLTKFPVIRDLAVDRRRFFDDLQRVKAWVPIDATYDLGPGPAVTPESREQRYALSKCIGCGCCLEACPQYTPVNEFVGAAALSQARLFNDHPTGASLKPDRLDSLMEEGGVQDCAKSGNCVKVCPKKIPLLESIAAVQRQATLHAIRKIFS